MGKEASGETEKAQHLNFGTDPFHLGKEASGETEKAQHLNFGTDPFHLIFGTDPFQMSSVRTAPFMTRDEPPFTLSL